MRYKFIFVVSISYLGLIQSFIYAQNISSVGLTDPSSVNCLNLGGYLKPLKMSRNSENMLCVLDGREIDSWVLLRETHPNHDEKLKAMPESK